MTRITHTVPMQGCATIQRAPVTLPTIPGVEISNDRPDTAPRLPTICRKRVRPGIYGAARKAVMAPIINARIAAIREALEDAQ